MAEYWFVIKSGQEALFQALKGVLAARPGFHVVIDRRIGAEGRGPDRDRRAAHVWEAGDMLIARTSTWDEPSKS